MTVNAVTVAIFSRNRGDAYAYVHQKSEERRCLVSVSESLQLMLGFGGFTLTFILTIIAILNFKDKK